MQLDAGRSILPVAIITPNGPKIIGHFDLPIVETIDPVTGANVVGVHPKDAPLLLLQLMHDAPEDSGTWHRPSEDGYHTCDEGCGCPRST